MEDEAAGELESWKEEDDLEYESEGTRKDKEKQDCVEQETT